MMKMPISETVMSAMMMGKIRFTPGKMKKKLFRAKIAGRYRPW